MDDPSRPKESRPVDGGRGTSDEGVDGRRTRVTEVIDGDTIETAEFGRVRLIGVDTPEEGRCYETAATRFTRERSTAKSSATSSARSGPTATGARSPTSGR